MPQLGEHPSISLFFFRHNMPVLSLFRYFQQAEHHSMVGSSEDPPDGKAVAVSVFSAVVVYAVFLVFCGMQAYLHVRQSKKGAISLR